jgi:hypothetical protein
MPLTCKRDLTPSKCAPADAKTLLGLGSKFIVTPKFTTGAITPSYYRLERDLQLRVYFAGGDDSETFEDSCNRSNLRVKSNWKPSLAKIPAWVDARLSRFFVRVQKLFKRKKADPNLLPSQERLLESLSSHPTLLFPETDKGLGPCAVEYDQYVEDVLIHLRDESIYKRLSKEEAFSAVAALETEIKDWLRRHRGEIGSEATAYISNGLKTNADSPFGQFYILYKIHKGMKNGRWPTRPVCSDVSSLSHCLGKWVNEMLTPIQQAQKSYFKDSFELKKKLDSLNLPPNALLFTSDATSMYTNIDTEPALESISEYLRQEQGNYNHYNAVTLIEALEIVFRNNFFKFSDTYWHQVSGTAMGTPPAPPWATCTYGLHEQVMLPRWQDQVSFYKRFIDDVIGIWLVHSCPRTNEELWRQFQEDMNGWLGLEWVCTEPSTTINFMDLTITIVDGKLETTLFEKAMNLYLYIPPHSAHPRGVFTGLVFGQILRIRRLYSKKRDADKKIMEFFHRLLARGHTRENLGPLFSKAEKNAAAFLARSEEEHAALRKQKWSDSHNQVFFHLQYHPEDPPSKEIQKLWQELVSNPAGETPLEDMENLDGDKVGIKKMVVAYSRPLNLRNRFSVRDIYGRGRNASEYLAK